MGILTIALSLGLHHWTVHVTVDKTVSLLRPNSREAVEQQESLSKCKNREQMTGDGIKDKINW